jgi:hypothetical protein
MILGLIAALVQGTIIPLGAYVSSQLYSDFATDDLN